MTFEVFTPAAGLIMTMLLYIIICSGVFLLVRTILIMLLNTFQSVDHRVNVYVNKIVRQVIRELEKGVSMLEVYKDPSYLGSYVAVMLKRRRFSLFPRLIGDVQYMTHSNLEELARGLYYGTYMIFMMDGQNIPISVKFQFKNTGMWKPWPSPSYLSSKNRGKNG